MYCSRVHSTKQIVLKLLYIKDGPQVVSNTDLFLIWV